MAKIQAVAKHIADTRKAGEGLVVVAGAVGKTTDKLIALAKEAGDEIPKKELEAIIGTGEQQTVSLLAIALSNLGVPAESMRGFRSGIVTNKYHSNTRINEINTERVEEILADGKVAVVSGFQGVGDDCNADDWGKGGADITAVGIAAHLGWECQLYTEEECLYTVDPEIYPEARPIRAITYEEMMEVSNLGSDKVETRAVELAKKYNVKLYLGKSLEEDKSKGTYIVNKEMIVNENLVVEDTPVTGMGIQEDISIFTLRNMPADGKAVAECFKILGELGINVDMISQQMAKDGTCTVSFSCENQQGDALASALAGKDAFKDVAIDREGDLAMISLVGVGMATHSGVSGKVFEVLAENSVKYYHITTSEISISVTVAMDQKLTAAIALCRAFQL
jgi:aspartate kinase